MELLWRRRGFNPVSHILPPQKWVRMSSRRPSSDIQQHQHPVDEVVNRGAVRFNFIIFHVVVEEVAVEIFCRKKPA